MDMCDSSRGRATSERASAEENVRSRKRWIDRYRQRKRDTEGGRMSEGGRDREESERERYSI